MITITTRNSRKGLTIESEGHAAPGHSACAGVSSVLYCLHNFLGGSDPEDRGGRVHIEVPPKHYQLMEFIFHALNLLADEYPDQVTFTRQDTRLPG